MRAVMRLVLMPVWRSWFSTAFIALMAIAAAVIAVPLMSGQGPNAKAGAGVVVALVGMAGWFWHIILGAAWSNVLRADLRLMPYYRRRVYGALALSQLLWVLPGVVCLLLVQMPWLAVAGMVLFLYTVGFCSGLGAAWASWMWLAFPLFALVGDWLEPYLRDALESPLLPILPLLAVALALRLTLSPRLAAADEAAVASPFDQSISDQRSGMQALTEARNPNPLARLFGRAVNRVVEWASLRPLAALERRPRSAFQRWRGLRALLLPHEQLPVVLLQALASGGMLTLVLWLVPNGARIATEGMGTLYAVLITLSRLTNLHRAVLMLRPSTTDAYFAFGASDALDFQGHLAQALLGALFSTLMFAAVLLGLMAFVLQLPEPGVFVASGLSATAVSALFSLGLLLMTTDSHKVRPLLFGLLTVFVAAIASALSYQLFRHFRFERALMIAAFAMGIMATFTASGYRDMVARRPVFDPPQ